MNLNANVLRPVRTVSSQNKKKAEIDSACFSINTSAIK